MKIGLVLSFVNNSLDGSYYLPLFEKFIKFEPYSFSKNYITKAWDEKKHKKSIMNASSEDSLGISSNNYDLFSTNSTGTKKPHRTVGIIQDRELFFPSNDEILSIINQKSFIVAYLYDEEYEYVQSTPFSNNYEGRNLDCSSIKNTPYKINEFGKKEYDIRYNPGKMDLIGYCWLMPAWKMWFGNPFFEIVPKDKILSFPDAYEIKELADGKVFVQLYEKVEESASIVNMEKQKKWRKWMDFEKLIEILK